MAARDKLQDLRNLVKIIEWYEVELAMKNKIIKDLYKQKIQSLEKDKNKQMIN
jgi:hypothetical protein|tara:strand:+ start:196 stop:354 length:159 start_codon:yes stop_codon:yes gene_type:complete